MLRPSRVPSATWLPTVRRGLSEEYGFWKTSWSRTRSAGRARRVMRASPGGPRSTTLPPAAGTRPTAARARRRLAAARLPDEADDAAAVDAQARAGDGAHRAVAAVVVDDDVGQLERAHPSERVDVAGEAARADGRRGAAPRATHDVLRVARTADGRRSRSGCGPGSAAYRRSRRAACPSSAPGAAARRGAPGCTDGAAAAARPSRRPHSTTRPA